MRIDLRAVVTTIALAAVIGAFVLFYLFMMGTNEAQFWNALIEKHFATIIGLPFCGLRCIYRGRSF